MKRLIVIFGYDDAYLSSYCCLFSRINRRAFLMCFFTVSMLIAINVATSAYFL